MTLSRYLCFCIVHVLISAHTRVIFSVLAHYPSVLIAVSAKISAGNGKCNPLW